MIDIAGADYPLCSQLGITLLHFLWQGAAIAALLAIILRALGKKTPGARYVTCGSALLLMAMAPVVTLMYVRTNPLAILPTSEQTQPPRTEAIANVDRAPVIEDSTAGPLAPASPIPEPVTTVDTLEWETMAAVIPADETAATSHKDWLSWAVPFVAMAWLLGVAILSLRLMFGWRGLHRLRWHGTGPLPASLQSTLDRLYERLVLSPTISVLTSSAVTEPVAFGLIRPIVLLPMSALTRCPVEMIEAMIAHELAHIRRHDLWVNVFQRVVETLLFYHPAVWWVSGRMRLERELCCDDLAVSVTHRRADYASALVELSQAGGGMSLKGLSAAMGGPKLTLLDRVRRVLELPWQPQQERFWLAGPVSILLVAMCFTVACLHATSPRVKGADETAPARSEFDDLASLADSSDPVTWTVLNTFDANGLLHGLTARLGAALKPSRREEPMWEGVENGGRANIEITVEDDIKGDVYVGFFADPRWWLAEPVQVRQFPGPGRHVAEDLIPGKFYIGAMIGSPPRADALGIDQLWPRPVEIKEGKSTNLRIRVSKEFEDNPCGQGPFVRKGFSGQWDKMDPARLVTVRTVDADGRPVPFCRIVFHEREEGKALGRRFFEVGTDAEGYAYCDQIDGTFSLVSQRFDFIPQSMAERYQLTRKEKLYDAKDRPVITLRCDPYPVGTGKVIGRVHDQTGQPLTQYFMELMRRVGEQRGWGDKYSHSVQIPVIDAEGRYEITGLVAGEYQVMVRAFDYPTHVSEFDMARVTVPKDKNATARLDIEVEAKELRYGRAVYTDGAPVSKGGWLTRFSGDPDDCFSYLIDPDGSFRVCLSREERRKFLEYTQGLVQIRADRKDLGEVHVDKLSLDPDKPTVLTFDRPTENKDEDTAASKGDTDKAADGEQTTTDNNKPEKQSAQHAFIGRSVEPFELVRTDGRTYRLADYEDKPVLINVFATWCGPCEVEMRYLAEFSKLSDANLPILAISRKEKAAVVENYARQKKLPFPILVDPKGEATRQFEDEKGEVSLPTTILLDRKHEICYASQGFSKEEFEQLKQKAIALIDKTPKSSQ